MAFRGTGTLDNENAMKVRSIVTRCCLWLVFFVATPGTRSLVAFEETWTRLRVPGFWEKAHGGSVESHDGYAWYRAYVHVPAEWKGQKLELRLGRIDDCDQTFFNETKIGGLGRVQPFRGASNRPRRYKVPAKLVRPGAANLIAVRVYDGGGAGGISHGPVRLVCQKGRLDIAGLWEFILGDGPNRAKWPGEAAKGDEIAARFLAAAGPEFGRLLPPVDNSPLPGTKPLRLTGDISRKLVSGVDRFLLRETERSLAERSGCPHYQTLPIAIDSGHPTSRIDKLNQKTI